MRVRPQAQNHQVQNRPVQNRPVQNRQAENRQAENRQAADLNRSGESATAVATSSVPITATTANAAPVPSGAAAWKKRGVACRSAMLGLEALAPRKLGAAARVAIGGLALIGATLGSINAYAVVPTQVAPQTATHVRMEQLATRAAAPSVELVANLNQVVDLTERELLRSVEHVSVSAVVGESRTFAMRRGKLVVPAGTRLSAHVDGDRVVIQAKPAVVVAPRLGPDVLADQLVYSFDDARFHVEARGVGPDFLYTKIASWVANDALKPHLPAALQQPGFDPHDRNQLEMLQSALAGIGSGGKTNNVVAASSLRNVSATVALRLPRPIQRDLAKDISLEIPAGTRLDLTVTTSGAAGDLTPESATLRASGGSLPIVRKGDSELASAHVQSLTLARNAHATSAEDALTVSATYDLTAETAVGSVGALFGALVHMAQGAPPEAALQAGVRMVDDMRLTGIRAKIDESIAKLGPRFATILLEAAPALPGLGLEKLAPPTGP